MAQICGGCGAETTRLLSTVTERGKLLPEGQRKEVCPHCSPETFGDPFAAPSDRKIWPEHIAKPDLYQAMPDGSVIARDEVLADLDAAWQVDPDAEERARLIAKKRATRRTDPLTPAEIEIAEKAWRPIVQQHYETVRQMNQADEDYTEAIVEKYVRAAHDTENSRA